MRILITGGKGRLGRAISRALMSHEAWAAAHGELDVTDPVSVDAAFDRFRPDAVVHCAALTDTAFCERDPERARRVNGDGVAHVARACRAASVPLIAVSTNEVFDGKAREAYTERDVTGPINAYGRSKLAGEQAALSWRRALVVRTSWLYGGEGASFVARVIAAAAAGGPLRFVTDEIAAPTHCDDLAAAIARLAQEGSPPGVYHLAGEGEASRYDWAVEILRLAGSHAAVEPATTAELRAGGYAGPEKPRYSVLANTRARSLGIVMRDWRDALAEHMARSRERAGA